MSDSKENQIHAQRGHRRTLTGVVVSDKMDKTVTVEISRRVLQAKFGKYSTKKERYKAHSAENEAREGDRVLIVETRPLSKTKRWTVQKIVERNRRGQTEALA